MTLILILGIPAFSSASNTKLWMSCECEVQKPQDLVVSADYQLNGETCDQGTILSTYRGHIRWSRAYRQIRSENASLKSKKRLCARMKQTLEQKANAFWKKEIKKRSSAPPCEGQEGIKATISAEPPKCDYEAIRFITSDERNIITSTSEAERLAVITPLPMVKAPTKKRAVQSIP